jgi:hypothetical protein
MTKQDKQTSPPKKNIAGELLLPLCALIFTFYYITTVIDSPWTAQFNAFLVGSILITVIAIFLINRIMMLLRYEAQFHIPLSGLPTIIRSRQSGFIILTVAYLLVIEIIGFTLTTGLFFWSSMLLLDRGKAPIAKGALATIMALVAYGIFIPGFETRLPKGIIEKILAGIF